MEKVFLKGATLSDGNTYVYREKQLDYFVEDALPVGGDAFPKALAAILLKDLTDVTLDFCGAKLTVHGKIIPIVLIGCKNVTIKNVILEQSRSHYTEGEIRSFFPGRYRIHLNEKFPFDVQDKNLLVYGDGWKNEHIDRHPLMFMQFFEKDTRKGTGYTPLVNIGKTIPLYDKKHFFVHHLTAAKKNGDLILKGGLWMKRQKKGTHVVLEHETRELSSIVAHLCDDLTLKNIRILNGAGMGFIPICCHNVDIDSLTFTCDELSHGYVTNAADGLHAFGCSGRMTLTNSVFEGMIDDALNIHGNYFIVRKTEGNTLFATCGSLAFSDKDGPISHTYYLPLRVGDKISINRGKTLARRDVYTIKDLALQEKGLVKLLLDRPAQGEEGDLIEDVSAQVDLTIRNCVFAKTNTHLRFQTRGKVTIEKCVTELPFWLTGDTTYWFESSPCTDFTVKNCQFSGNKARIVACPEITPTKDEPYYHKNITVEDCVFDSPFTMDLRQADNITFVRNRCSSNKKMRIVAKKCGAIKTDNAVIVRI